MGSYLISWPQNHRRLWTTPLTFLISSTTAHTHLISAHPKLNIILEIMLPNKDGWNRPRCCWAALKTKLKEEERREEILESRGFIGEERKGDVSEELIEEKLGFGWEEELTFPQGGLPFVVSAQVDRDFLWTQHHRHHNSRLNMNQNRHVLNDESQNNPVLY